MELFDIQHNYVSGDIVYLLDIICKMQDKASEFGIDFIINATITILNTGSWFLQLTIKSGKEDADEKERAYRMLQ